MKLLPRAIFPLILLGLALAGTAAPRGTPSAEARAGRAPVTQADCTAGCTIMLPLISVPLIAPTLIEPSDLAQVDSVAPLLQWTPAITGTKYYIEVATSSTFISDTIEYDTAKTFKVPTQEPQSTVPGKNLKGATTYYWRVGVELKEGINYSPVRQFTTAPLDLARLPAAPSLLSPADGARLTTLSPVLTWAPMLDAIAYRVRLLDSNNTKQLKTSGIIDAPKTSYTASNLLPKLVYYWQVRTYNSYGWGDYGPVPGWRFRTP